MRKFLKNFWIKISGRNEHGSLSWGELFHIMDRAWKDHCVEIEWGKWVTHKFEGSFDYPFYSRNYNIHIITKSVKPYKIALRVVLSEDNFCWYWEDQWDAYCDFIFKNKKY